MLVRGKPFQLARRRRSYLFDLDISDNEKGLYNIDTRIVKEMEPLRARVLDRRLVFSVVERIRLVGYDDGGWVEKNAAS